MNAQTLQITVDSAIILAEPTYLMHQVPLHQKPKLIGHDIFFSLHRPFSIVLQWA